MRAYMTTSYIRIRATYAFSLIDSHDEDTRLYDSQLLQKCGGSSSLPSQPVQRSS